MALCPSSPDPAALSPRFKDEASLALEVRDGGAASGQNALSEADRDLVLLDGKGWGRRPVRIILAEPEAIEPGLLLFAAFVVHRLAVNAANTSAATSTAATSSSSG